MAKLILFLTLVSLQVFRLTALPVPEEGEAVVQNTEISENLEGVQNEEWTEEDKTWLQQVMQLLEDNDKEWTEKEDELLKDIIQKWFTEIGNWFEDDDDDDDDYDADDDGDWWGDSDDWWDDSEEWSSDESDYFNYSELSEEEEITNTTVNGINDPNMKIPTVGPSNKFKRFSSI